MRKLATCLTMVGILAWPSLGLTIDFTDGGWSTSFDYPSECFHSGVLGTNCTAVANDGVEWGFRGGKNVDGNYTQVTSDANNPDGDGGRGARFWVDDGDDVYSGEARVHFPNQEPEIWIRWYVRYERGFAWAAGNPLYDKWLFCRFGPDNKISSSRMQIIPESSGRGGRIAIFIQAGGDQYQLLHPAITWQDVFGTTSDGLWHMIEMYVKMDTDSTDGIGRLWIDGQLVINKTDVDFSGGDPVTRAGMKWFEFQSNQNWPNNGGPMYVDYDDMAVYKTTPPNTDRYGFPWIGPLNGFSGAGSLPKPMPPDSVDVSFYDSIEGSNLARRGWHGTASVLPVNTAANPLSMKSTER